MKGGKFKCIQPAHHVWLCRRCLPSMCLSVGSERVFWLLERSIKEIAAAEVHVMERRKKGMKEVSAAFYRSTQESMDHDSPPSTPEFDF